MRKLREDDLVWQDVDGEIVVLDTRASSYLGIKGSGALLWKRLSEGATAEDLAATLVQSYGIDAERAAADVAAFLDMLQARDLLSA